MGLPMSYPLCYHNPMMKMKTETLFEVLTFDGEATLGFVRAYDKDHAKRIGERLYCKGVLAQPAKQFPRFDGKKFGEFNR